MQPFILNFQVLLIIFARIFAMLKVAPLTSSTAIPGIARVGFALLLSSLIMPTILLRTPYVPANIVLYFLLLTGEALIGIIIGFYLDLIYTAFQLSGQFFSLQMGFGASEVFDPLAQYEIPLVGQFLNIVAMFVFLTIQGFYKFIYFGIIKSFENIMASDLVVGRGIVFSLFLKSLGYLFENALTIAFPILGTLMLISVTTGLLAKAAPQMNLLMMGFPIAIGTAFVIMLVCMPFLMQAFANLIDNSFSGLQRLFLNIKKQGM